MPRDGILPQERPHPLETVLAQEWQSAQLAQSHVGDVLNRILEAWRQDRAEIAGLRIEAAAAKAELAAANERIAELEAQVKAEILEFVDLGEFVVEPVEPR